METKKLKEANPNTHYLWWMNPTTRKKFCAGRAIYLEKSGVFAVFINLLENGSHSSDRKESFYLKPITLSDKGVYYKLEKLIERDGKIMRFNVGEGFKSEKTSGDIHIHLEPLTNFYKKLVIELSKNEVQDV